MFAPVLTKILPCANVKAHANIIITPIHSLLNLEEGNTKKPSLQKDLLRKGLPPEVLYKNMYRRKDIFNMYQEVLMELPQITEQGCQMSK